MSSDCYSPCRWIRRLLRSHGPNCRSRHRRGRQRAHCRRADHGFSVPAAMPTGPLAMPTSSGHGSGRPLRLRQRLAPGDYHITRRSPASRRQMNRAVPQSHGVAAGQTVQIDVHLQKGGVIAGKLLEASGEPMTDASVMAMRRINMTGWHGASADARAHARPAADQRPWRVSHHRFGARRVPRRGHASRRLRIWRTGVSRLRRLARRATTTYYPGTI